MRHFIVCRHPRNQSGEERDHLAVSAVNPVRAAELYGRHLATVRPTAFKANKYGKKRMLLSVMEIDVDDSEGVRTAKHSEGDLWYSCRLENDGDVTNDFVAVDFLPVASQYAADGETVTGEW